MADKQPGNQDPDAIRRNIAETRLRMERNIHALQNKLDPERLKFEAKSTLREQTVGRVEDFADNATDTLKGTGEDVFESIKQNPLPAALAAIGLGWLFMESRNTSRQNSFRRRYSSGRSYYGDRYYGDRYDWREQNPDAYEADYGYDYDRGYQGRGARYPQPGMTDRMRGSAGQMADQARGTVRNAASNVSDTASQMADMAQRRAYQAKTRFQEVMDENPLLIGAAAVALGAAIGLSLPHTEKEDELLGEVRDNFMDKAQDQAKTTMDKVQQVAQRAGDAAKDAAQDEAQKQNLTSTNS